MESTKRREILRSIQYSTNEPYLLMLKMALTHWQAPVISHLKDVATELPELYMVVATADKASC